MSQKFLSPVKLSGISTGSILKVDSNGVIVAAVDGTDYNTGSSQWTTSGNDIYYTTGNVGIGESSPDGILHIKGSSQVTEFYIESSTGTASTSGAIKIGQNNRVASNLGGEMVFSVQSSNVGGTFWREAMTILHTGWVGIGTSSPSTNLDVSGSANISGNVGIGTTSPQVRLTLRRENNGSLFELNRPASNVEALYGGIVGNNPYFYSNNGIFTLGINNPDGGLGGEVSYITMRNGSTRYTTFEAGNVGIGTTSPSDKLTVNGNISLENSGTPIFTIRDTGNAGGGGAAGMIIFKNTGGDAIGIGYTGNDTTTSDLLISTNAASTYGGYLGLDADAITDPSSIILDPKTNVLITNGNVGIGTTSPASILHISASSPILTISNTDTSIVDEQVIGQIDFKSLDSSTNMTAVFGSIRTEAEGTLDNGVNDGGKMVFSTFKQSTSLVDQMVIDGSGNVGIGNTSPSYRLDVAGDARFYDSSVAGSGILIDTGAANLVKLRAGYPGDWVATSIQIQSSTTSGLDTGMYLESGGNVGIGTTSPSYPLQVNGVVSSVASAATMLLNRTGGSTYGAGVQYQTSGTNNWVVGTGQTTVGTDYQIYNYSLSAGALAISYSSNNVGINITNPTEKLQVGGSAAITVSSTIDPDSYRDYVVIGYIADGGGWAAKGIGGNAGTGDSWAIGHNGSHLYFGIGNGTADNSLSTWMQVSPARAITFPSLASAGFLKTNASGTLSVDTNTYSLSGHTHTAATTSAAGFMSASDKTKLDGITDAADAYGYWRVSDGTNTENIASQNTLTFAADGSASVTYDTGTNTLTIGAAIVEADTLNTVVSRGSTTTSAITLGPSATNGGPMIYQTYSSDDKIGSIGSEYSSGAMLIGYGAAGKNGGSGYVSTFDNFSGHRGLIKLSAGEFSILNTGSAVQTTTGDALTMTTRFVVNNDGNVGIGTTSPAYKLDVAGEIRLNSGSSFTDLNIKSDRTSGNIGGVNFVNASDEIKGQIYGNTDGSVRIGSGGATLAMFIDSSQKVGIGVTSPSTKLHVLGSTRFDSYNTSDPDSTSTGNYPAAHTFTHYSEANGMFIVGGQGSYSGTTLTVGQETSASSNFYHFKAVADTNGTPITQFVIRGDGKVGIGTTSPSYTLDVNGSFNATSVNVTNDITTSAGNLVIQNGAGIYSIKSTINTSASGTAFRISNTNDVQAARVTFVAETANYQVAKIYEVVKAGTADPVAFKVVDTGPSGEEDFSVAFTNDGGDLLCTVTNDSANESLTLVTTIFVGGSNTSQTVSNS